MSKKNFHQYEHNSNRSDNSEVKICNLNRVPKIPKLENSFKFPKMDLFDKYFKKNGK